VLHRTMNNVDCYVASPICFITFVTNHGVESASIALIPK